MSNLKVNVLMSTYNGERFLDEQIQSLMNQRNVCLSLMVRDDGSTDGTIDILEKYQHNYKDFYYYKGENKGACESFLDLIYNCSLDYDYYAFCDQDDIWLDCKLYKAIEKIKRIDKPALYYSAQIFYKDGKKYLRKRKSDFEPSFFECLLKSDFPGCTMVLNKAAFQYIRSLDRPKHAIMHDWFVYQCARGTDFEIIYDRNSYILYRLHGENVSVLDQNVEKRIKRIVRMLKSQRHQRMDSNRELMDICRGSFDKKNMQILFAVSNYIKHPSCLNLITKKIVKSRFTFKYKMLFLLSFLLRFY